MIINRIGKGSGSSTGMTDATISANDVMYKKTAYGSSGKVIGTAPFEYIGTEDSIDNYKVLQDEMDVILPNGEKKILKIERTDTSEILILE